LNRLDERNDPAKAGIEQRTLGQETEGKRAWGCFAIAMVK